jgi:glucosamine--fructose-6-phosphate aminotransferase (isomerizing)
VDAAAFAADIARKPETLEALAATLDTGDPWAALPRHDKPYVVLVGMGSSYYASCVVAAQLRARGVHAVAELASSDLLPRVEEHTIVVAVSAGGGSRETLDAVDRLAGGYLVALTNRADSPLAERADLVVPLLAGTEEGGVACLTYAHTVAQLLTLAASLTGQPADVPALIRAGASATRDLLTRRDEWLEPVTDLLAGPDGTCVVAPAHRLASALQSALMLREGPRRPAVGCETGDWAHVEVYLTKTTDYRLLLLGGSRWEDGVLEWTVPRRSTVVAVGAELESAAWTLRYAGDTCDDVRLLAETTVAELVAARLWQTA